MRSYIRLLPLSSLVVLGCTGSRTAPGVASVSGRAGEEQRPTSAHALVGTWELASTRITRGDSVLLDARSPDIRALKLLNGSHYSVITLRGDRFMRAGAGRYTLAGSTYSESVELASGRYTPGRTYTFRSEIDGDAWTIDGGEGAELFHEVWQRVR